MAQKYADRDAEYIYDEGRAFPMPDTCRAGSGALSLLELPTLGRIHYHKREIQWKSGRILPYLLRNANGHEEDIAIVGDYTLLRAATTKMQRPHRLTNLQIFTSF